MHMLRRMRWLWLSILLIMAFNTPGELLSFWPWQIAPTYEGLIQGATQIARLALMLMLIALMTSSLTRDDLLAGFYCMARPIGLLGLSAEKLATRLWLTINYIQQDMLKYQSKLAREQLLKEFIKLTSQSASSKDNRINRITISIAKFGVLDYLITGLMVVSTVLAWGRF